MHCCNVTVRGFYQALFVKADSIMYLRYVWKVTNIIMRYWILLLSVLISLQVSLLIFLVHKQTFSCSLDLFAIHPEIGSWGESEKNRIVSHKNHRNQMCFYRHTVINQRSRYSASFTSRVMNKCHRIIYLAKLFLSFRQ